MTNTCVRHLTVAPRNVTVMHTQNWIKDRRSHGERRLTAHLLIMLTLSLPLIFSFLFLSLSFTCHVCAGTTQERGQRSFLWEHIHWQPWQDQLQREREREREVQALSLSRTEREIFFTLGNSFVFTSITRLVHGEVCLCTRQGVAPPLRIAHKGQC